MRIGDWSSDVCSSDLSVEKDDSGEAMVAAAIAAFGRLDIVVANAASPQAASFHKLSLAHFRVVFDVGFFGTLHLVLAAWPRLRAPGYGRLVTQIGKATARENVCQYVLILVVPVSLK